MKTCLLLSFALFCQSIRGQSFLDDEGETNFLLCPFVLE